MSIDNKSNKLSQTLLSKRMLACLVLGFSAGLPLYLLLQLVPAWLRTEGLDLKTIAAFAFIQLPYTWKFIWAPLVDRYNLIAPLGRRRSWMLITQVALFIAIAAYGSFNPKLNITSIAIISTLVAFFSASQDIAIDAFRREILSDEELGLGSSIYVNAYRIAGLVPGSLALILAGHLPWSSVFWIVALFMIPGMLMTLFATEPHRASAPKSFKASVVEPFTEFIQRAGLKHALWVLLFILLYKLGDSMATALATPFYLDMGYSLSEIGIIAKNAGLWPAIISGILGGIWMLKMGINRALWVFGFIQLITILGFAWLAHGISHELFNGDAITFGWLTAHCSLQSGFPFCFPETYTANITVKQLWLAAVIGAEAIGVGLGTAAYVAYMARETNPAHTATQLALFTSLSAVPRSVFNALTGGMVESLGWEHFFYVCTLLAIPGMLLLFKVAPWNAESKKNQRIKQELPKPISKSSKIGGLLYLAAVGILLSPILNFMNFKELFLVSQKVGWQHIWSQEPIFVFSIGLEFLIQSYMLLCSLILAFLFFGENRRFPKYFMYYVGSLVLLGILAAFTTANLPNINSQQVGEAVAFPVYILLLGGLWSTYFLKSKRSKQTFVVE